MAATTPTTPRTGTGTPFTWTVITPTPGIPVDTGAHDRSATAMEAAENAYAVRFPQHVTVWAPAPTGEAQILERVDPTTGEWLPTGYVVAPTTTSLYGGPGPDGDVPPTPVDALSEGELRMALSAARAEITAHLKKWAEVVDSFDPDCTPGCLGSRLVAPCEDCAAGR